MHAHCQTIYFQLILFQISNLKYMMNICVWSIKFSQNIFRPLYHFILTSKILTKLELNHEYEYFLIFDVKWSEYYVFLFLLIYRKIVQAIWCILNSEKHQPITFETNRSLKYMQTFQLTRLTVNILKIELYFRYVLKCFR